MSKYVTPEIKVFRFDSEVIMTESTTGGLIPGGTANPGGTIVDPNNSNAPYAAKVEVAF